MEKILSQDEMKALLNSKAVSAEGGRSNSADGAAVNVEIYNFRRPDRFPKAALHSLQLLHDRFCTGAAASLSAYFHTLTEMSVLSVEQATFGEFLQSMPDPTCLSAISMRPLEGMAVLEMGLDVAFPLIDRLLGGLGGPADSSRKITEIEKNVIRGVINLITVDWSEAWRPVTEVNFQVHSSETRPQLLQVASPNEVVLIFALELKIGETRGTLHLCIPFSALEPILGTFEQGVVDRKEVDSSDIDKVLRCLLRAPTTITCELPMTMVTVNDLLSLTTGDVMKLDCRVDGLVKVRVGGSSSFQASLMDLDGHKGAGIVTDVAI